MKIQPIVEGHGEVAALPELLRRLIAEAQTWNVSIGQPIRKHRSQLVRETEVKKAVRLALLQPECRAVLILFDGDSDCPAELGPTVQTWAADAAGNVPCVVVIAHREYEAWFLASIESLRGYRGTRNDAQAHPHPENPRGAKEQLESRMNAGASYFETTDQPAFSAIFSLSDAYRRSRSFRKLVSSFEQLVRSMGQEIGVWPPAAWAEDIGTRPAQSERA